MFFNKSFTCAAFIFTLSVIFFSQLFSEEPPCLKELERRFFQPQYVNQALAFHDVSQSAWNEINRVLNNNLRKASAMLRNRAERMNPNPLNVPFQWQAASHLLQEVLLEIFTETLVYFNITNSNQIKEMFDYILQKQRSQFIACFGEEELEKHK